MLVNLMTLVPMLAILALGALTFQPIDRPQTQNTLASGINDEGWIVGTSATTTQEKAETEEGFLLRGAKYTTIFYPKSFDTDLGAINNRGVIFGTYGTVSGTVFADHCFTWSEAGGYKTIPMIAGAKFPDCNGINDDGAMVGSFVTNCLTTDPGCKFSGTPHGFLITEDGTFKQLDAVIPGSVITGTEAFGINSDGDIVGSFTRLNKSDGAFLLHNGKYSEIPVTGSTSVDAYGINDDGEIVGAYTDLKGRDHCFLLSQGKVTTIDVPYTGAETNKVTGINDDGWMVGVYTDANGTEKGFKVKRPD